MDKSLSKHISYLLRHKPGLVIDNEGYVLVTDLLTAVKIDRDTLNRIVINNDKQRFSYDPTGTKIRANQGHSIVVNLELKPEIPPPVLYHGTSRSAFDKVKKEGLQKMNRNHVHLSTNKETAMAVGLRHCPHKTEIVILEVNTSRMLVNKHEFYLSSNGVWLTNDIPPQYLTEVSIPS
jgi:putative RNA 2'-phosphotransferase